MITNTETTKKIYKYIADRDIIKLIAAETNINNLLDKTEIEILEKKIELDLTIYDVKYGNKTSNIKTLKQKEEYANTDVEIVAIKKELIQLETQKRQYKTQLKTLNRLILELTKMEDKRPDNYMGE